MLKSSNELKERKKKVANNMNNNLDFETESVRDLKETPIFGNFAEEEAAKQSLKEWEAKQFHNHGMWSLSDLETMSMSELKKLISHHKQDASQCKGVAALKELATMCLENDFDPDEELKNKFILTANGWKIEPIVYNTRRDSLKSEGKKEHRNSSGNVSSS